MSQIDEILGSANAENLAGQIRELRRELWDLRATVNDLRVYAARTYIQLNRRRILFSLERFAGGDQQGLEGALALALRESSAGALARLAASDDPLKVAHTWFTDMGQQFKDRGFQEDCFEAVFSLGMEDEGS